MYKIVEGFKIFRLVRVCVCVLGIYPSVVLGYRSSSSLEVSGLTCPKYRSCHLPSIIFFVHSKTKTNTSIATSLCKTKNNTLYELDFSFYLFISCCDIVHVRIRGVKSFWCTDFLAFCLLSAT